MHLLLLEDQKRFARYLERALSEDGHAVQVCHDGEEGLRLARHGSFDLLILDLMLPGKPGFEVLAELRKERDLPVFIISARDDVPSRVRGLEGGADDFLIKPFAVEEFRARVRVLLRRGAAKQATVLNCGDLRMDLVSRKVTRGPSEISLTSREFSLLEYLLRNPGRPLPRTSIAEHVWGYTFDWESNVIEVFINQLRSKIDRDREDKLIRTVRGVGYEMKSGA